MNFWNKICYFQDIAWLQVAEGVLYLWIKAHFFSLPLGVGNIENAALENCIPLAKQCHKVGLDGLALESSYAPRTRNFQLLVHIKRSGFYIFLTL